MTIPILYCLVTGSAITDILKNKIYNLWMMSGLICGIAVNLLDHNHGTSFSNVVMKLLIAISILTPIYFVKGIGGGDLKLLIIISMFISVAEHIWIIIISLILGAIFGLMKAVLRKDIHQTVCFAVPIMISTILVTGKSVLLCI